MIEPNLARLMSQEDQQYYRDLGLMPDPAKEARTLKRNEINEQRVFSRLMTQRRILFVNPRSDQKSTIAVGHPDFTIFLPNGRMFMVEMKVPGGRLSPEQIGRIEALRALGHQVEVCWSADEAWKLTCREYENALRC
jgi:VRR-NUC domain